MYQKLPDDPWFENIDPYAKIWMFFNLIEDNKEKAEFAKQYSILTGSFSNPKMANEMLGKDSQTYETDPEQLDELLENIKELNRQQDEEKQKVVKRRRRRIKG